MHRLRTRRVVGSKTMAATSAAVAAVGVMALHAATSAAMGDFEQEEQQQRHELSVVDNTQQAAPMMVLEEENQSLLMQHAEQAELMMDPFEALHRTLESDTNNSSSDDHDKPLVATVMTNLLLFMLIFGMSATVDMVSLRKQIGNKFAILTGVAMQFLIMPFLGYLAVIALQDHGLTDPMGLTLLIVTASPGGSYSNWWCSLFNADLALSVAMTALSTILSTALLPANLMLYAHAAYGLGDGEEESIMQSVDFKTLFISLGVVIGAILTGLYASYKVHSAKFRRWANRFGTVSGLLLILFSAVVSSGGGSDGDAKLWEQDWTFFVGVSAPCLLGLALANLFSRCLRLPKPEVVTISVECCYQNVGIATSAAVAMFDDPQERAEALIVPLFYGLVEAIVLGIYCIVAWKIGWTKAPKDEKFCVIISKTYEVEDDVTHDDIIEAMQEMQEMEANRVEAGSPKDDTAEDTAAKAEDNGSEGEAIMLGGMHVDPNQDKSNNMCAAEEAQQQQQQSPGSRWRNPMAFLVPAMFLRPGRRSRNDTAETADEFDAYSEDGGDGGGYLGGLGLRRRGCDGSSAPHHSCSSPGDDCATVATASTGDASSVVTHLTPVSSGVGGGQQQIMMMEDGGSTGDPYLGHHYSGGRGGGEEDTSSLNLSLESVEQHYDNDGRGGGGVGVNGGDDNNTNSNNDDDGGVRAHSAVSLGFGSIEDTTHF